MLNNKQLGEAAKCNVNSSSCSGCSIYEKDMDCLNEVAKTALSYREMIEDLLVIVRAQYLSTYSKPYAGKLLLRIRKAENLLEGDG